ncbi:MAG: right-handed parallel beta-helix repeat-containing protein [Acidobacteriia bacterium]|nr:right-handed parallel beta-helix repeat-containing protein [Terriglobia bacterium]
MRKGLRFFMLAGFLPFAVYMLMLPLLASAASTVTVDCRGHKANIKTIKDGLAQLPAIGPSTLLVSGTCHENVLIQGYQFLTVQGNPTATIDGGTDINHDAVDIFSSSEVALNNFTITGGGLGVWCGNQSLCRLNNLTVENALDVGIYVGIRSILYVGDSTVQNNAELGLGTNVAGVLVVSGTMVQGNGAGIYVSHGGDLLVGNSETLPTLIQNNAGGSGIATGFNATMRLDSGTISGNGGDGVQLAGGSAGAFWNITITGNSGHGVRIGDLSYAQFGAEAQITGNRDPDVVCDPEHSATRGIQNVKNNEGTTNCPEEPPTKP